MMTPGFLAGAFRIGEENSIRALIPAGSTVAQLAIYGGALLLVALAVFIWAVALRRQRRPRRHPRHHRSKPAARHHRQPEVLPRPRTLAEAGGLPPIRNQQPPPSQD
jgi:hypothetical protein